MPTLLTSIPPQTHTHTPIYHSYPNPNPSAMPRVRSRKPCRSSRGTPRHVEEEVAEKKTAKLVYNSLTKHIYERTLKLHDPKNVIEPMQSPSSKKVNYQVFFPPPPYITSFHVSPQLYCIPCSHLDRNKENEYHSAGSVFRDWNRHLKSGKHIKEMGGAPTIDEDTKCETCDYHLYVQLHSKCTPLAHTLVQCP